MTPSQQIKVSFASAIGSTAGFLVGSLLGAPTLGSAAGGAIAGAIAAKFMEGSSWQDVANSAAAGALSGLTGVGIGSLLEGTLMSSTRAAMVTGVISGMSNAILMGPDPIFKESDMNYAPCN